MPVTLILGHVPLMCIPFASHLPVPCHLPPCFAAPCVTAPRNDSQPGAAHRPLTALSVILAECAVLGHRGSGRKSLHSHLACLSRSPGPGNTTTHGTGAWNSTMCVCPVGHILQGERCLESEGVGVQSAGQPGGIVRHVGGRLAASDDLSLRERANVASAIAAAIGVTDIAVEVHTPQGVRRLDAAALFEFDFTVSGGRGVSAEALRARFDAVADIWVEEVAAATGLGSLEMRSEPVVVEGYVNCSLGAVVPLGVTLYRAADCRCALNYR